MSQDHILLPPSEARYCGAGHCVFPRLLPCQGPEAVLVCPVCALLPGHHVGVGQAYMHSRFVAQATALLTKRCLLCSCQGSRQSSHLGLTGVHTLQRTHQLLSEEAAACLLQLSTGNSVLCPVERSNQRRSTAWLPCSVRQVMHKKTRGYCMGPEAPIRMHDS